MLGYGFGYGYGYYSLYYVGYGLVLIGAILSMIASARVNSTYRKYAGVRAASGMTGAQAARRILDANGMQYVRVEHIRGELTDHYDPRTQTVRLSDATYGSSSVAAIGVAAHECGHALQHKEEYVPLSLRSKLVPAANLGSRLGLPIVIAGVIFGGSGLLIQIGILVFTASVLFQLVTLPVEFNASSRAMVLAEKTGILGSRETEDCKKVLSAAAMTYVAAAASSILMLLRLLLIANRGRRDD